MPDLESGDAYIRRIATFIRTNEARLAEAGFQRRRPKKPLNVPPSSMVSALNPLSWFPAETVTSGASTNRPKPLVFSIDTYHLFYLLIRLEAAGYNVGSLDVQVEGPSRPMSYVSVPGVIDTDALSMSSIRSSLSTISRLSLGVGIWGRAAPPSVDDELKYIYSSFTKIPALSLRAPGPKQIAELANEPPNTNALPLDVFRNLQSLECVDIDPRSLLGWDRLADSLWSLTMKRSGMDDVSDLFIGCVLDDMARRTGGKPARRRRSVHGGPSRQASFHETDLPETIDEGVEESNFAEDSELPDQPGESNSKPPGHDLPPSKWGFLRHLSLADNALTFFPAAPLECLTSLTHLDLSSNLLVSVPVCLGALYNLTTLNMSDNMIDSVLGIYKRLGQVLTINLAHNRLESLCGLERLLALERVDVRSNFVEDAAEVGRLAPLPNIRDIWVEGNPFTESDANYRIAVFDLFWREGKTITLDGSPAGYYERQKFTTAPPEQMSSSRPVSAYSPPALPVGASASLAVNPTAPGSPPFSSSSSGTSPALVAHAKPRKKKPKRIVDLDAGLEPAAGGAVDTLANHVQEELSAKPRRSSPLSSPRPPSKHRRSQTDAFGEGYPDIPTGTATLSRSTMKRKTRAARMSASVYEPAGMDLGADEHKEADAFRARIEALRSDVGEGWLKVFSQSQVVAGS